MHVGGEVWGLVRNGRRIADLVVTDTDFPWLSACLRRLSGFDAVEHLFRAELVALDAIDTDIDAWTAAYDAIRAQLDLLRPDGTAVPEFLLHVEGDIARWRWEDEPFED